MFEAVEFPSEGALLRGRFYRPDRAAPFPAVVMAHGTTATITMALDRRVPAVAVQCPTCGAEKPNAAPTDESFQKLQTIFAGGDVRGTPATTTGPLPVVSSDQLGRRRCSSRSRHSSGSSTMAAGTERCGKTG
jgi:hypothetical protein